MIERELTDFLIAAATGAAVTAGRKIMEIYNDDGIIEASLNSNNTPARFMVTPNYALLVGGYPYAILVRLRDIAEIRPGQEKKLETRRGAQTRAASITTLYTIGFYRRDRADRDLKPEDLPDEAMGFFSQEVRDKALAMLAAGTGRVRASGE